MSLHYISAASPIAWAFVTKVHTASLLIWIDLKPRRLPRNFSNIIVGVVYHPPSANDNTMKEYLLSSLESLESKFPNCAINLAGDLKQTLLPILERAFRSSKRASLGRFVLQVPWSELLSADICSGERPNCSLSTGLGIGK